MEMQNQKFCTNRVIFLKIIVAISLINNLVPVGGEETVVIHIHSHSFT